jgi:hypothetical protein
MLSINFYLRYGYYIVNLYLQEMKLLIDIADNKAADFMKMIKNYSYVKSKTISPPEAEIFEEIKEIKKAFKNAELIKAGKLKGRSATEFLNEI